MHNEYIFSAQEDLQVGEKRTKEAKSEFGSLERWIFMCTAPHLFIIQLTMIPFVDISFTPVISTQNNDGNLNTLQKSASYFTKIAKNA